MSDVLLIVPNILAAEEFNGCLLVPHQNQWPMMSDLPRDFQTSDYACVAATAATDADSVRQMLAALANEQATDRRIVFAEDAMPAGLRAAMPEPLCSLLQRPQPRDLMCISTKVVQASTASDSFCATVLRGNFAATWLPVQPRIDRFPQAGPPRKKFASGLTSAMLTSAVDRTLAGVKISHSERKCITAGILLLWDFLDESHEISQTMEGRGNPRTADYWHGIMHRREPDAGNAAYWFRRVGSHPAFDLLASNLVRWMLETGASEEECLFVTQKLIANGSFDPFALVELSTQALRKPGHVEDTTLRRIQYLEILNLLAWSIAATN